MKELYTLLGLGWTKSGGSVWLLPPGVNAEAFDWNNFTTQKHAVMLRRNFTKSYYREFRTLKDIEPSVYFCINNHCDLITYSLTLNQPSSSSVSATASHPQLERWCWSVVWLSASESHQWSSGTGYFPVLLFSVYRPSVRLWLQLIRVIIINMSLQ